MKIRRIMHFCCRVLSLLQKILTMVAVISSVTNTKTMNWSEKCLFCTFHRNIPWHFTSLLLTILNNFIYYCNLQIVIFLFLKIIVPLGDCCAKENLEILSLFFCSVCIVFIFHGIYNGEPNLYEEKAENFLQ